MYSLFAATLVASLAPQALANLYITSPVASTSCASGQPCNVAWNDDGQKPSLSDIGACTVGLFVGSQTQQTLLQDLGPVDVSKQANAQFNPVASIGPVGTNGGYGNEYFLRFTSTNFKDPNNPQFNFEGFTAKFALTGMTGQFNATIQQQIAGATGAASPSATGSATASPSASPSASNKPTSAGSSTSAASKSSGTPSGTSNAGERVALVGHSSALVALVTVAVTAIAAGLSV